MKSVSTIILLLVCLQHALCLEPVNPAGSKEDFQKKFGVQVLDSDEVLKMNLVRFVPHLIGVFSLGGGDEPNYALSTTVLEELKFDEKAKKAINMGFNVHVVFCSTSLMEEPNFKNLCAAVEESDLTFTVLPGSESPIEDKLGNLKRRIFEELPTIDADEDEQIAPIFVKSIELAGKYAIKTLGNQIRSFPLNFDPEQNMQILSSFMQNELASKGFVMMYFSRSEKEKVKMPTGMKSLSNFYHTLVTIGHAHNPGPEINQMLGLPAEETESESLLIFLFANGNNVMDTSQPSIGTYVFDPRMYGKYTALSMFTFVINCFHQISQQNPDMPNAFNQWLTKDTKSHQLPMYLNFDTKNDAHTSAQFTQIEPELQPGQLHETCTPDKVCVIGLFPTDPDEAKYQAQYMDKFNEIFQKSKESVFVNSNFDTVFAHAQSCKAYGLLEKLGLSEYQLPTIIVLKASKSDGFHANHMLKAFSVENAISFVRTELKSVGKGLQIAGSKFDTSGSFVLEKCENIVTDEPDEDMEEWLKEIREEEIAEEKRRKKEAKELKARLKKEEEEAANAEKKQKKKAKKKKKSKKKSKTDL